MSLYNVLLNRGYDEGMACRYPTLERSEKAYGGRLAPLLYDTLQNEGNVVYGLPTDAKLFDDEDLPERELVMVEVALLFSLCWILHFLMRTNIRLN